MEDSIKNRFDQVNSNILTACRKTGRNREDVTLVVVTKGQPAEKIMEVVEAGADTLGENYPEETILKIDQIGKRIDPAWHMIGHLQSRKIKLMYPHFNLIHSVDSVELANKLNAFYSEKNKICNVLIEVNIAGEESKYGFEANTPAKRDDLLKIFENLSTLESLEFRGLMTMPPYAIKEDQNEECYNLCRELLGKIRAEYGLKDFSELSMGTSADYLTAIGCGATYVRVGEAIMGKRPTIKNGNQDN
jgi:PLP dependent protein